MENSKRIFLNDSYQKLFEKQGYMVLPFITDKEVKELSDIFDAFHPSIPEKGFVSGSYSSDFSYKKRASDEIVRVFSKHYERLFTNYVPFGGAFLFKVPSEDSYVPIHQDWTIVDETQYVALNCWVPLTDTDENNGTLHVLPGSHFDAFPVVRSPTLPFFFKGNEDVILNMLKPLHVKAGHVVILNQSLVHYSSPNRSSSIRKAITAGVKSSGARMMFHYNVPEKPGTVEVFDEEDDFLIRFDNFYKDISDRPKLGISKGYIEYEVPVLSRTSLTDLVNKMSGNNAGGLQAANKPGLLNKMLAYLK